MRRNAVAIFIGNAASKLLGAGREILSAALFGTGEAIGAFRVSLTGSLVPMNFFTGDALNSAFIPVHRRLATESEDAARTLVWCLFVIFALLGLAIALTLWQAGARWTTLLAPGLEPDHRDLAVRMLRVLALGVPCYLLASLAMYVCMARDDFIPMASRAAIQNVGMISGAAAAFVLGDVVLLAWGFTASYVVFLIWVLVRASRCEGLAAPRHWNSAAARRVLTVFWRSLRPLLLLPILLQGNIVIERIVASLLGIASISALDYARFVTETLILCLAVPIAFSGLAHWSRLAFDEVHGNVSRVLSALLLCAIPVAAYLAAHADLVVHVLYVRGAFDRESADVTSAILFGAALGVWAHVAGYVLVKALNAQLRNRAVLVVTAAALFANVAVNLGLYERFGAVTLGLGIAVYGIVLLAGTATALRLWPLLCRQLLLALPGIAGYLLLVEFLPLPESAGLGLALSAGAGAIYWAVWILAVPSSRRSIVAALGVRQDRPS